MKCLFGVGKRPIQGDRVVQYFPAQPTDTVSKLGNLSKTVTLEWHRQPNCSERTPNLLFLTLGLIEVVSPSNPSLL